MVSRRKNKKLKVKALASTQDTGPVSAAAPPETGLSPRDTREAVFTFLDDGSPVPSPLRFTEAYGQLMQVALARAKFYGYLLAQAQADEGEGSVKAFIEEVWVSAGENGGSYKSGEYIRALVVLEAQERDRAARLLENALRFGIEARNEDLRRDQVRTLVLALRNMAAELDVPDSADTRRMMQRAIIDARRDVLADAGSR